MPIGHDMFIPPSDCEVEQRLIQFSQFRLLKSICGHLGLFGVDPELLAVRASTDERALTAHDVQLPDP
jgi:homoserine O-acetyltransferase